MTERLPLSGRFEDFSDDLTGSPDFFRINLPSIDRGISMGAVADGFRDRSRFKPTKDSDTGRFWRLSRNMFLLGDSGFWIFDARGVSSSDVLSVTTNVGVSGDRRWLREEGSPLALNTAGVGVEFSGGHMASSLYPRTLLARGAMVGRVPSETLEELVSVSSDFVGRSSDGRGAGFVAPLSGGVGGCNVKFAGVCVEGEVLVGGGESSRACFARGEDEADLLRGMRGRGPPAPFDV
jgi:hypothetical protein